VACRNDNITSVLLVTLLLAGCSSEPELGKLGPEAVVLAFGDSLTFGKGAAPEHSYPAVLATLIDRRVVGAGVSGEITATGLARLPAVLAENEPDLVIICHGGNDILRRLPSRRIRNNLRTMLELVRASGAAAILVAVPGRSLTLAPPELYAEVAAMGDVLLEDEVVREVLSRADLKSDSVHPNAAGYRLIAERLAAVLRRAGAI